MKKTYSTILKFLTFSIFLSHISINSFAFESKKQYKIIQWNIQTFFDAVQDGIEYQEFQKNKKWNKNAYEKRLNKLIQGIKKTNADIYVFEEIENQDIILDISNKLAGNSWNENENWKHGVFAKNPGDSIGCAVLSKYPISNLTIHNLDERVSNKKMPSMRPVMKMSISINEKDLILFVNHWKSKSGGAEESEFWRDLQENNLARLVYNEKSKNPDTPVIMAGDFNRDIKEFYITSMKNEINNIALRMKNDKTVTISSPWIEENQFITPGSYFFNSEWERIDHIFYTGKIQKINFKPLQNELWCNEEGIPVPYKIYNEKGFSDHLPIQLIFEFQD